MRKIDQYRIVRLLGEGLRTEVHEAVGPEGPAALKIVKDPNDSEGDLSLREEFRILAGISHPNIVRVHDFGRTADGRSFFTMELIQGCHYNRAFRGPSRPFFAALAQVLGALHHIHYLGLVHGDLKPANMLVARMGKRVNVKLTDFGMVQDLGVAAQVTYGGTPGYMAPEVLAALKPDARADLYSLGIVLMETLGAAAKPANRTGGGLLRDSFTIDPPEARCYSGDVPAPLQRVLERMTARLPENRPRGALEVMESLRDFLPRSEVRRLDAGKPPLLSSSLVGRKREINHLLAQVKKTSRSRNLMALVIGPIGIGKSRLLRELKSRAQLQGLSVLGFACKRTDRRPLGPFTDILRDELASVDREAELLPEYASLDPGQLMLQYELVARRFERIARESGSRTLVLVDDLGFARPAVRTLLEYLVKYCETHNGIAFIATADTELWEEADRTDLAVDMVMLKGLSAAQTKKLISNILGFGATSALAHWVHRYSGGVPLLVEETLGWLHRNSVTLSGARLDAEQGKMELKTPPRTIGALTSLLIKGLQKRDLEVLKKAAVVGDVFNRTVLREISGLGERNFMCALGALASRSLIQRETGELYSFTHAWLAGSLYPKVKPEERSALHGRIVRVLESSQPHAYYDLAHHASRAGLKSETARYGLAAAREAREAGSFDSSIEFFRLGLSCLRKTNPERARVAEELADCQIWKGDNKSAISNYIDISRRARSPEDRARLLRKAALSHHLLGEFGPSTELLLKARSLIEQSRGAESVRALLLMGWNEICTHDYEKAEDLLNEAHDRAARLDDKALLSRILRGLGTAQLRLGRPPEARKLALRALSAARASGVRHVVSSAQLLLATAEHEAGHARKARNILNKVLALTRQINYLGGQGSALVKLALIEQELGELKNSRKHYEDALRVFLKIQEHEQAALTENNLGCLLDTVGDWEAAKKSYSSALRRFREMGATKWTSACLINIGRIQVLMGEAAAGVSSIEQGMDMAGTSGFWPSIVEAHETLSSNHANQGDLGAALEQAQLGIKIAREKGVSPVEPVLQAAEIHLRMGDRDSAAKEHESVARMENSDPSVAARVLRLRAQLFPEAAWENILRSVSIYEQLDSKFDLAQTLLVKALLCADGVISPPDGEGMHVALSSAQRALDIFRSLGAKPYVAAAAEKVADYKGRARRETETENVYLKTIFAVNKMLDLLADQDSMLDQILDLVIGILGAERGMLLLLDEEGNLIPAAGRKMDRKSEKDVTQISRTVVRNVAVTGRPTLSGNAADDPRYMSMPSIMLHGIKSLMCVPLVNRGEPIGSLYVDSTVAGDLFTPYDDEFLLTIGNLLASSIDKSRYIGMLESRNVEMKRLLRDSYSSKKIVGSSGCMKEVLKLIWRYAETDRNVLISGERGTGKGLVAKALHFESPRRDGPFVIVDAAHIPGPLIEDALFGHARGAFSGAYTVSPGLVESARNGTIFLDNIGTIHPDVQAKLLRPLQSGEVRRLGSTRSQHVDFRVVSATSIPIEALLEKKALRLDLYLVLKVLEIHLPPLRERGTDVLELALHFLEELASESGKLIRGFSREAVEALLSYSWPGNVTELKRCTERAVTLCPGEQITADELGLEAKGHGQVISTLSSSRDLAELSRLSSALTRTQGNVTLAAEALSISRRHLQRLLKKHGLTSEEFRASGKRSTPA
jgi:Nif-specific regulatory protein